MSKITKIKRQKQLKNSYVKDYKNKALKTNGKTSCHWQQRIGGEDVANKFSTLSGWNLTMTKSKYPAQ